MRCNKLRYANNTTRIAAKTLIQVERLTNQTSPTSGFWERHQNQDAIPLPALTTQSRTTAKHDLRFCGRSRANAGPESVNIDDCPTPLSPAFLLSRESSLRTSPMGYHVAVVEYESICSEIKDNPMGRLTADEDDGLKRVGSGRLGTLSDGKGSFGSG